MVSSGQIPNEKDEERRFRQKAGQIDYGMNCLLMKLLIKSRKKSLIFFFCISVVAICSKQVASDSECYLIDRIKIA